MAAFECREQKFTAALGRPWSEYRPRRPHTPSKRPHPTWEVLTQHWPCFSDSKHSLNAGTGARFDGYLTDNHLEE
jgi:hypothetical protein